MFTVAYRNLVHHKARLMIAVGGVALALLLILSFDAILAGIQGRIAAYIDQSGADVFVSQSGVRNLHMITSSIPASVPAAVQAQPGVASATPILYRTDFLLINRKPYAAYVIGLPPEARTGGPRRIVAGTGAPHDGTLVLDRDVAAKAGVGLGDSLSLFGSDFTIAGLSEGLSTTLNSVAFITMQDFAQLRGDGRSVSFVLATVTPGQSPDAVSQQIERSIPGVTARSRQAFAAGERKVVGDMTTDIVRIMNTIASLIGLAVVAVVIYIATFTRRAEYGVLKAVGARSGYLYRTVLLQSGYCVLGGFIVGLAFTLLLAVLAPRIASTLSLAISGGSLLKVGVLSLVIAGMASILPIWQLARLDPASVFRGGTGK